MSAPASPQRRILVVDDEPFVCDAVKMMLNFDGHTVETAHSAQDALAMFDQGKFDLVITDFAMPKMKGDEYRTSYWVSETKRTCGHTSRSKPSKCCSRNACESWRARSAL